MPWFDCSMSLVDLHSSALRRNSALSVPVGGHRCTVTLPGWKKEKGNVYFQKQGIIQIHWTAKRKSSKADNDLAGPSKARAPVWTSSLGSVAPWLADGSDGGSDQLCSRTLSLKAWYLLDDRLLCSACFSSWLQLFSSFSRRCQRYGF